MRRSAISICQHFVAADDRIVERLGSLHRFEDAVDSDLDEDDVLFWIDVDVGRAALEGDLHELVAQSDDVGFLMLKLAFDAAFASERRDQSPELAARIGDLFNGGDCRVGGRQLQAGDVGGDGPLGLVGPADAVGRHQVTGGGPFADLFE